MMVFITYILYYRSLNLKLTQRLLPTTHSILWLSTSDKFQMLFVICLYLGRERSCWNDRSARTKRRTGIWEPHLNVKLFRFVLFFEVPYTVPIITRTYAEVVVYLTLFSGPRRPSGISWRSRATGRKGNLLFDLRMHKTDINLIWSTNRCGSVIRTRYLSTVNCPL